MGYFYGSPLAAAGLSVAKWSDRSPTIYDVGSWYELLKADKMPMQ